MPSVAEEKHTEQVLVRMSLPTYKALYKLAKRNHRTIPGEIRLAIEKHLKGQK